MSWKLVYSREAVKDAKKIFRSGLKLKVEELLLILEKNPFLNPPSYEKLNGDLKGFYSRRINVQHRLVYEVYIKLRVVKILSLWNHYE